MYAVMPYFKEGFETRFLACLDNRWIEHQSSNVNYLLYWVLIPIEL